MEEFLFYISGWLTFILLYYICEVYVLNYNFKKGKVTKKLILYRGAKYGVFSWGSVLFLICVIFFGKICYWLLVFDSHVEDKLNER